MNKTQLQQKIVNMEKQLAELKKELEKKDKGIWKPKRGEEYCYLNAGLNVIYNSNDNLPQDAKMFECGNFYKYGEEAEKMANYLKYTNLLRKYVEEHSEPLDWENHEPKYCIWYDHHLNKELIISNTIIQTQGIIYASSEEVLRDAIEFVGEDNVLKHIFQVEKD